MTKISIQKEFNLYWVEDLHKNTILSWIQNKLLGGIFVKFMRVNRIAQCEIAQSQ